MITPLLAIALQVGGPPPQPPVDRWFAEDKMKHFVASFLITSVSASAARFAGADGPASLYIGVGVGATAGMAKEISDHRAPTNSFSYRDILWDIAGIAAAAAVADASR